MKKVSSAMLAKLQSGELVCFSTIEMQIGNVWYRYTDCDIPLVIDSHTYEPAPIKSGNVNLSVDKIVSSFSLKISALMSGLKTAFLDGNPQNNTFIARLVFLNHDYYTAYATNVLTNPSFETGALGDWNLHVGEGAAASASVVAVSPYDGTYCAKIAITDSWGTAEKVRDIMFHQHTANAIVEGNLYDITFAAKASSARKIAADIYNRDGSLFPIFNDIDLTTSWQFFIIPYIAGYSIAAGSTAMNFYLARENCNGIDVYIDLVRFSDSLYPITLFRGYIDKWSLDEEWIDMRIVSALAAWTQKRVRRQPASCRWLKFKGTECQYAGGETWCDRSYTRCAALNNTQHFGGFRWLPYIAERTIYWGRYSPKTTRFVDMFGRVGLIGGYNEDQPRWG